MRAFQVGFAAALGLMAIAAPAHGQLKVIGGGLAGDCSLQAINGEHSVDTVKVCTEALEFENLTRETTAMTFVNRGVVYLRRNAYIEAERDFASAQDLMPDLAEIYINRGVTLYRQNRWTEAAAELSHGIELAPHEPAKAYFDRALAREALADFSGAYADFAKAAQLKPDWALPRTELQRYVVTTR